jgi:hypothetical protein
MSDARTPLPGSGGYIQNQNAAPQASSTFSISGNGTAGGTLTGNVVSTVTQFNIGASRILSAPGTTNLFVGRFAGQGNTTGSTNSFFGSSAGSTNTNGIDNSFFGYNSGAVSNGTGLSFFGSNAGSANTIGNDNAFFGSSSGLNNTSGNQNAFFGPGSGVGNTTGSNNTLLGRLTNVTAGSLNYATAIGADATVGTSNTIAIGRSAGQDTVVVPGTLNVTGAINGTVSNATNATQLGGIGANSYVLTADPRLSDARVPLPNSTNYIQNSGSVQANSNFNISGNGTAGGSLSANAVNASTHYNLNGLRILGVADTSLFVGHGAGFSITTGSGNSFVGPGAGNSTSTGGGNTFVGYSTGSGNVSGYNNTLIGNQPNVLASNLSNATAVGAFASVGASNSLVLGAISGNNFCSPTTNCETVKVGIGTTAPAFRLDVGGRIRLKQDTGSTGTANTAGIWLFQNTPSIEQGFVGMKDDNNIGLYGNNGGGWSLFTDVSTGVTTVANLGSAGSTTLCRNASFQISSCSSSARYKDNINAFSPGLDLIRRLRPVSFNWKDGGMLDMGLVAEEVNAVEPLLTSTNSKGEVEGVKYDRVGVVLINAVKEQQSQIEAQQKLLEQQRAEIEALKALVCSQNPGAAICRPKN